MFVITALIHLWSFSLENSWSNDQLLTNQLVGKCCFNQHCSIFWQWRSPHSLNTVWIQWHKRGDSPIHLDCASGENLFIFFNQLFDQLIKKRWHTCDQLPNVCFKPGLALIIIIEWLLLSHFFYLGQSKKGLKSLSTIDFIPLPHFRYYSSLPFYLMCVWIGSRGKSQRQWYKLFFLNDGKGFEPLSSFHYCLCHY